MSEIREGDSRIRLLVTVVGLLGLCKGNIGYLTRNCHEGGEEWWFYMCWLGR